MSLVVLPAPERPTLTVRALAKVMVLPAFSQADELRAQKFPRAGSGKQRVPYYQRAISALRSFVESGLDPEVLERAMAGLDAGLAAAEEGESPDQALARFKHNLRLLSLVPSYARLRDVSGGRAAGTHKVTVEGVELRSTPDLLVVARGAHKAVFLHTRDSACDDDEARRTLELAHWVQRLAGNPEFELSALEYWVLAENRVLKWAKPRQTTITRARKSLPILLSAWEKLEPPKAWTPREAVADSDR